MYYQYINIIISVQIDIKLLIKYFIVFFFFSIPSLQNKFLVYKYSILQFGVAKVHIA